MPESVSYTHLDVYKRQVERLPPDARPAPAVEVISGQRVADGCKMYPYLVGPARHRDAGREAQAVFGFQYGIFRPAGLAVGGDAAADDALPLPPDGGVDDARPEGDVYKRQYMFSTPLAKQNAYGKSLRNRLLICIIGF